MSYLTIHIGDWVECLRQLPSESASMVERKTIGWKPGCKCGAATVQPCTVLDPFGGSGTTGMVALEHGRKSILIELNADYVEMGKVRCDITPALPLA